MHLTEEAVSPKASFICKDHPREIQVQAAGRKYNPITDEADKDVHFQDHQFDKNLGTGTIPEGGDREDSIRLLTQSNKKHNWSEKSSEERPE